MMFLKRLRAAFILGTPVVAIALFALGMISMLTVAVLHYQASGDWVYLAIWASGMTLFVFAIWPIRKRLLELL